MTDKLFIAFLIFILFQGCAKIGKPTGGPEDLNPPEFLNGVPENRSVNFDNDQIDIFFDEYIQLKDQNREIIISPPMKEKPVVRVRDKSVRITFNEDLSPGTTYTLNFGKALSDLNEGNLLPDFEYVFSTGNMIDSLSVTGKVVDAFTKLPEAKESLLVMLYENLSDSAPLVEIPRYYNKTNQFGLFAINNIRPDTFRLIAVKDANNNMMYDAGLESIAFLDSMLVINSGNVKTQSYIKDTIKIITQPPKQRGNRSDTLKADTVIAPGKILNSLDVSLFYFTEENSRVYITDRKRPAPEKFSLVFNRPLFDDLKITPVNFQADSGWYLLESSRNNDSLTYWVRDTVLAKKDTFMLQLTYLTTDSTGLLIPRIDTVNMRFQSSATRSTGRKAKNADEEKDDKKKELLLSSNLSARATLNLNSSILITADRPISSINPDSIEMFKLVDTLLVKEQFDYQSDTISPRKFMIRSKWEEDTKYKLLLKPGTVRDIYGISSDTVEINFTTQKEDFYGKILMNFECFQYPMIIQVLDEKGNVVSSKETYKSGVITFDFLVPGKYGFKAIYDPNNNGRWDTGNYLKHRQPEKIYLWGKPQQLRSNWDWEQTWKIIE
jgi:hypothetical protein